MKDDVPIIKEIINHCESIDRAKEYFGNSQDSFLNNEYYQNSCLFSFIQIGENVKRLSGELTEQYNTIRWKDIAGFRDYIAHNYGYIEMSRVWGIIEKSLPELLETCKTMIRELSE